MAIPTISNVSPSTVHPAGQLITITGTNFRLPTEPAAYAGVLPEPIDSVSVTVNGEACTNVRVYSATRLTCECPSLAAGAYNVVVKNLNDAGTPIALETVTLTNGLTYARPNLAAEGDYQRIVRAFIRLWKKVFIENVVLSTSVDYAGEDERAADVKFVEPTKLPALALSLKATRDRNYRQDITVSTQVNSTTFKRYMPFTPRNVEITMTYLDNSEMRFLNAQQALDAILAKVKHLKVDRGDGTFVNYEMEQEAEIGDISGPNLGDVKAFQTKVVVYGVETQGMPGNSDFLLTEIGQYADQLALDLQADVEE